MVLFSKKNFAVTFEGLQGLIDEFYNFLIFSNHSNDKLSITNCLPRSVFSYYIWMNFFLILRKKQNFQGADVNRGIIPLPLQKYIAAIGNVESKLGIEFELDFPVWPNDRGHFGKITEYTHYYYETMAAPAILAQRIREDLAYTHNPTGFRSWNLWEIAPDEKNAGLPTKNLLGWDLREKLNSDQESFLQIAGITIHDFPTNSQRFMYNHILVTNIDDLFRKHLPLAENLNENMSNEGSTCQMLWLKRVESVEGEEVFNS